MSAAVECVQRFQSIRALVIGDVMLDSYLEGTASRICSEAPVPVVRKTGEERVPGGAGNTAVNLRALGAQVDLIGITGRDAPGRMLREALAGHGIDDRFLVEDQQATTHHKLRVVAQDQYLVRYDEGDTWNCSPATSRRLLAHLEWLYPQVDVVIISDYCYGAAPAAVLDRLRALRSNQPIPLIVDSKNLHAYRDMDATVVTPNLVEAQSAAGRVAHRDGPIDLDETTAIGRRLRDEIRSECVAVTLGADGVLVVDGEPELAHVVTHSVRCVSDIGAGDSFAAALGLGLAAGAQTRMAARIGIEASALAVMSRRTALVRYRDLLQRLSLLEPVVSRNEGPDVEARLLAQRLDEDRRNGRTIVFANGMFDSLHAGHVQFLRQARQLGDVLVVGVNSDRSLTRIKTSGRPMVGERERLSLAASLEPVDYAVLFDEPTPADLIRILRPEVHAKGGDYAGQPLPESAAVEDVGGRFVILPLVSPPAWPLDGAASLAEGTEATGEAS